MVKTFRCTANKILFDNDYAECWYCKQKTQYSMSEKDGSEILCCFDCMWKEGKIKKFSPSRLKATLNQRKSKIDIDLCVKKSKDGHHSSNLRGAKE